MVFLYIPAMRYQISVLLIDPSLITSTRLIKLLENTKTFNVHYTKDVKEGCSILAEAKIDVIILATHIVNDQLIRLVHLCEEKGCKMILLTEYTHLSYKNWCTSIGISYILDKAYEANQLVILLKQMLKN